MGTIRVAAERTIQAPPESVYETLRDLRERPQYLPSAFSDYQVHSGGVGAGTVTSYTFNAGRRTRQYRMEVSEPEPGRVLAERDTGSSLVTRYTVSPDGSASRVSIETTWEGAGGVGGFFERTFAPRVLREVYADELQRLDAYVAGRGAGGAGTH